MYQKTLFSVMTNSMEQPKDFYLVGHTHHSELDAQRQLEADRNQFLTFIDRCISEAQTHEAEDYARHVKATRQWKIEQKQVDYTHASQHLYSDVEAWEIVKVVSDKCVEIRRMDTEHSIDHLQQIPGGFAGHVVNQQDQKVTYTSNPENAVIRIRRRKGSETQWGYKGARFTLREQPYAFYDYNF